MIIRGKQIGRQYVAWHSQAIKSERYRYLKKYLAKHTHMGKNLGLPSRIIIMGSVLDTRFELYWDSCFVSLEVAAYSGFEPHHPQEYRYGIVDVLLADRLTGWCIRRLFGWLVCWLAT